MIPYQPIRTLDLGFTVVSTEFVFYALAFAVFFIFLYLRMRKKEELNFGLIKSVEFFLIVFILSILGSRLWYYSIPWTGFQSLVKVFDTSYPGMNSIGVMVGGGIGIVVYIFFILKDHGIYKSRKLLKIFDEIAILIPLSIAIVRIGCYLDGHIIGHKTNVAWCIFKEGACRHPVALYIIITNLAIFIFLYIFFNKDKTENSFLGKRFEFEAMNWFLILYITSYIGIYALFSNELNIFSAIVMTIFLIILIYSLIDDYLFLIYGQDQETKENPVFFGAKFLTLKKFKDIIHRIFSKK